MKPKPHNKGGRREGAGRPRTTASGRKRERYTLTIDPALMEWLTTTLYPGTKDSAAVERCIKEAQQRSQ